MERSEKEMYEMIDRCQSLHDEGKNPYFGMTYLDGVREALRWALGDQDDAPIEDEE